MSIQKLFEDKEYCYSQIREARELFGNVNTTRKQFDAMVRVLGFGYLYCPEEIRGIFLSTLDESVRREFWYISNVWKD